MMRGSMTLSQKTVNDLSKEVVAGGLSLHVNGKKNVKGAMSVHENCYRNIHHYKKKHNADHVEKKTTCCTCEFHYMNMP